MGLFLESSYDCPQCWALTAHVEGTHYYCYECDLDLTLCRECGVLSDLEPGDQCPDPDCGEPLVR